MVTYIAFVCGYHCWKGLIKSCLPELKIDKFTSHMVCVFLPVKYICGLLGYGGMELPIASAK